MSERIQKSLARAGYASRRQVEKWIQAGRIWVNDKPAVLGQRINPREDRIRLDKRPLRLNEHKETTHRILALYKPIGVITTHSDPLGRPTIFDYLPHAYKRRWINVGRLDINTSGLLLFTNHGEWAHYLMHPSSHIEREYAVRILGKPGDQALDRLRTGVKIAGQLAHFTDIVASGGRGVNQWFHVVLLEGRNREVRRLWMSQGFKVSRLIRVRYGSCILPRDKRPGDYWMLNEAQVQGLLQTCK